MDGSAIAAGSDISWMVDGSGKTPACLFRAGCHIATGTNPANAAFRARPTDIPALWHKRWRPALRRPAVPRSIRKGTP